MTTRGTSGDRPVLDRMITIKQPRPAPPGDIALRYELDVGINMSLSIGEWIRPHDDEIWVSFWDLDDAVMEDLTIPDGLAGITLQVNDGTAVMGDLRSAAKIQTNNLDVGWRFRFSNDVVPDADKSGDILRLTLPGLGEIDGTIEVPVTVWAAVRDFSARDQLVNSDIGVVNSQDRRFVTRNVGSFSSGDTFEFEGETFTIQGSPSELLGRGQFLEILARVIS